MRRAEKPNRGLLEHTLLGMIVYLILQIQSHFTIPVVNCMLKKSSFAQAKVANWTLKMIPNGVENVLEDRVPNGMGFTDSMK